MYLCKKEYMKKLYLFASVVFSQIMFSQTNFISRENIGFDAVVNSSIDKAIVDGKSFFAVTGKDKSNEPIIKIYTLSDKKITLVKEIKLSESSKGVFNGQAKFIDIDRDGDLDLAVIGADTDKYYFKIFENKNNDFVEHQNLEGLSYSGLEVGDYDNDGDMDLIVNGEDNSDDPKSHIYIYQNNGGQFTKKETNFTAVSGVVKWIDVNNDGLLDVFVSGTNKETDKSSTKIYRQTNTGTFELLQDFSNCLYKNVSVAFGDFNNDSYMDFALIGVNENETLEKLKVFQNNQGVFKLFGEYEGLNGGSGKGAIQFGDLNQDGLPDLVLIGTNGEIDASFQEKNMAYVYLNKKTSFEKLDDVDLKKVNSGKDGSLVLFDYDGDLDIDIFSTGDDGSATAQSYFLENKLTTKNEKPSLVSEIKAEQVGKETIIKWTSAKDDHTPALGLDYEISIGTKEGLSDVTKTIVHGTQLKLKTDVHPLYFSIRTIDTSGVYSEEKKSNTIVEIPTAEVKDTRVWLYPNPVVNGFKIKGIEDDYQLTIYDKAGNLVKAFGKQDDYNVSYLAKAVYVVVVESVSGRKKVFQMIKK